MVLTGVMLFLVSVEPYLLGVLTAGSRGALQNFASQAYALDLAGLTLIMGLFAHQLTTKELGPELLGEYKRLRNIECVAAVWFTATALPIFWPWQILGTPARIALWYFALLFVWISRLSGRSGVQGHRR